MLSYPLEPTVWRLLICVVYMIPSLATVHCTKLPVCLVAKEFAMPSVYRNSQVETVGFWGEPTSTLDWCEENYFVTKYVAEFWNSVTNYFLIVPPLLAALRCYKQNLDRRFLMSFLMLMVVGIGSTLFHATLRYEMQLLDELPMIYGVCVYIYCVLACDSDSRKKNMGLKLFFSCFSIVVTVVYVVAVNPLVFQWIYGLSVAASVVLSFHTCWKYNASRKLLFWGLFSYAFGFILWNIDNNFCIYVRKFRSVLPWPVDALGQLHGWWHCLAAFGTYFQILYSIDLRMKCLKSKRKFDQVVKNEGSDLYLFEKHSLPFTMFRELWCWLPLKPRTSCEKGNGFNNNNIVCNGCKPM